MLLLTRPSFVPTVTRSTTTIAYYVSKRTMASDRRSEIVQNLEHVRAAMKQVLAQADPAREVISSEHLQRHAGACQPQ